MSIMLGNLNQPQDFKDKSSLDLVCELNKALYGHKQALRAWFQNISFTLVTFGIEHSKSNSSMFFKRLGTHMTIVLIYIDNIILTRSDNAYSKT